MMAGSGNGVSMRQPRSIAQITAEASEFEYNNFVHLRNWLRSARQLRQQAEIYEAEGNLQQAYLLYYREVVLLLEHLQTHPDVKTSPKDRTLLKAAQKDVEVTLTRLELLKPLIKNEYDRYLERQEAAARRRRESEKRTSLHTAGRPESGQFSDRSRPSSGSWEDPYAASYYDGHEHEHHEFALRVAQQARGTRPSRYRQAAAPYGAQGRQNKQPSEQRANEDQDFDLNLGMQNIRLHLEGNSRPLPNRSRNSESYAPNRNGGGTAYPSVPASGQKTASSLERQWNGALQDDGVLPAPARPEKVPFREEKLAPIRPPKETSYSSHDDASLTELQAPSIAPTLPPKNSVTDGPPAAVPQVFKTSAYLENGIPLRTVFFPPGMRREFLARARVNTDKKVETCGIICGFLKNNALFVSSLVIPEQTSTSDTCEMTDEGEIALFDWVDSHNLLTLGWIHTHPTQTCFMSSRDLHTHCGYQSMIQESIAVVCAPSIRRDNGETDYGIFRLTDPPGMPAIRKCTDSRVFHPHDVDFLYTDCQRPGHVVELDGLSFEVFDLRKGKS